MNIQPILENNSIALHPLQETDFNDLFLLASDPLVWEQHPNKDRYKKDDFQVFFNGAMESEGAFKIVNKETGITIGSTRFYDLDTTQKSVLIGYTFYGRAYWGSSYNPMVKKLMLDYTFQFLDTVYFHVGANNIRSQKAVEKLGATKNKEISIAYFGETEKLNFEYIIEKINWLK